MAKYRPIFCKIWADPDFQEYSPEGKLLFIYLCTNPYVTESGIYPMSLKTISNDIGIGFETVNQLLCNSLKNVHYDKDNKFIFVRNFRKYNPGGSPKLIHKSIAGDYKVSSMSPLWKIFFEDHADFKDIMSTNETD